MDVNGLGVLDSVKELQLQSQLIEAGVKLLVPSSSADDLLAALDKVEDLLSIVGQDPSSLIQDGLLPSMMALISDRLLRHPNTDVRISVMSCICEVLRISAPHQPYENERMKDIFRLTLAAFEKLSLFSGRCYAKALHILEIVAKVRCCIILLDIGCDSLVTKIFEVLLSTIKFNHPQAVFSYMEDIMTWLLDESDDIPLGLLKPLLASVKKENQITSPVSSWLGEKVLKNCSTKVRPYLMNAVKLMRLDINDYADIVASLCRDMPAGDNVVMVEAEAYASFVVPAEAELCGSLLHAGTSLQIDDDDSRSKDEIEQTKSMAKESVAAETLESGGEIQARTGVGIVPSSMGRESKSLVEREKDYEHSGMTGSPNSLEMPYKRKNHGKVSSLPHSLSAEESSFHLEPEKESEPSYFQPRTSHFNSTPPPISPDPSDGGKSLQRRGRSKKKGNMANHDSDLDGHFQGSDGHLRIGSSRTKHTEENPVRYSRRKKSAVKNNMERTAGVKNVVIKTEKDFHSDSEEQPLILYKLKDGRKGAEDKKALKSEVSKKPRIAKEYGEELVGSRIKVWWPMDSRFYEGVIASFDPSKKKHKVLYVDGDQEILNLKKERWFLLDDQEKKGSLTSSDAAAVRSRTRGRKRGRKSAARSALDILHIKTEIDVLAKDDEESKDEEENLRSETLTDASKSSN
ncbi:sister chromatid cohesion protein PDS5 homolog D-like isoform X1 [Coffea arabica]|uniref:Sister chromatid cohesion protein PDS5 homolog D-like isoform X1 n=1 Tax=Coffea arabica TaxID=13443 RepID=A0A6P6UFL3_COFAR|nr:uncharacterized protein LOC113710478 [Coffea arabica]